MLKYINLKNALSLPLLVLAALFSSCDNEKKDEVSPDVALHSFGPSVLRGGELKFIGNNLDKVTAIILPENVEVQASSFKTHTAELIAIDVPDEAVEGLVTLKTPDGDIMTKTSLSILEPITITSIPEEAVRPGEVITIEGTYLNLISEVIFATSKSVTNFEAQTRASLSIRVPDDAQTGVLVLLDSEEIPNEIETETELNVVLPMITAMSPMPVKPGELLTITGTDVDLSDNVIFGGGKIVEKDDFESVSSTSLVLTVPADALEGKVALQPASLLTTESPANLTLVAPAITSFSPSPIKSGDDIVITGTDLDLVMDVVFGGNKTGNIVTQSETSITVTVPEDASEGKITVNSLAKSGTSADDLLLIDPVITTISPDVLKTNEELTINGTDLDLVSKIIFSGGAEGTITSQTETEIIVVVPLEALSGTIEIETINSVVLTPPDNLTVTPSNLPVITSITSIAKIGEKITLEGEKMQYANEVMFPGGIAATKFGIKSETLLEVYIPTGVTSGVGTLELLNDSGESVESPEINIVDMSTFQAVIFDDAMQGGYGNWSWGGPNETPTFEAVFFGNGAIKKTYDASWDGFSWGGSTINTTGFTKFVFFVYGGEGTDGLEINLVTNEQWGDVEIFSVKEGEWKEVSINVADVIDNPGEWGRIVFQARGWAGTVYFDHVGFK